MNPILIGVFIFLLVKFKAVAKKYLRKLFRIPQLYSDNLSGQSLLTEPFSELISKHFTTKKKRFDLQKLISVFRLIILYLIRCPI